MSAGGGGRGGGESLKSAKKLAGALSAKSSEAVRVVVRVRPLSSTEVEDKREVSCWADTERCEVYLKDPRSAAEPERTFTFDSVFPSDCTQRDVYDRTAAPIVESVLEGFNGTIFAYGQTGAGKTFTMQGKSDPPELRGIMPNAFKHIFDVIALNEDPTKQFLVRVSYLEIYNEEIRDLLARGRTKTKLEVKESVDSGVYVKDLSPHVVRSAAEMDALLERGGANRTTGATLMNDTSSRSHSIFTVTIETSVLSADDGKPHIRVGKLNMVDLAGSERQSKTGAEGQRLKEAIRINRSLSALGNVISALINPKSTHIPYRDSKLTRLLQDSLGGNTRTVMIANCGPADYNYDETLSTLRYANNAKQIKNKPRINEDPKDAMLREFQEEIERLRKQLEEQSKRAESSRTVMVDGKEVVMPRSPPVKVVERVVEKKVGMSPSEKEALERRLREEKERVEQEAKAERERLLSEKSRTEEEREKLRAALEEQARRHEEARVAEEELRKRLEGVQAKLLTGAEIADKAAAQAEELRRAEIELEERKRQEAALARQLEEANLMIEEQYASMAEEVEVKTKKLKKVWAKWQSAKAELADTRAEAQREREEMLDSIRELDRQLKLRRAILDTFVPPHVIERLEATSVWEEETGEWALPRADLGGRKLRVMRPLAFPGATRAESEFARHRRVHAEDDAQEPRFRRENPVDLPLDAPVTTTSAYDPDVRERIALLGDEEADAAGM